MNQINYVFSDFIRNKLKEANVNIDLLKYKPFGKINKFSFW